MKKFLENRTLEAQLKNRWSHLEARMNQLTHLLEELEQFEGNQELNVKTTTAYIVLQNELKVRFDEQNFLKSLMK